MDRDFKGVWISKDIWLNKNLSMLEKVLFVEIDSLDNENHCTAGNDYFAEFCNCGTATITRAISHLKELGYIEELPYNGKYRTLRVIKMISQTNQNDESDSSKRLGNNIYSKLDNNSNNTNVLLEQSTTTLKTPLIKTETSNNIATPTPNKRKNIYEKCADAIDNYTEDTEIRDRLKEYLPIRLARKEMPLSLPSFKGMLNRLTRISTTKQEQLAIIQQAIDRQYPTFYEVKTYKKYGNGQDKSVFSEYGQVKSVHKEETIVNVQF